MKLKNFMENLNELIKDNPMVLELDVITSIDDEGNGFNHVTYEPTIGCFLEGEEFKQYEPEDESDEICDWYDDEMCNCREFCVHKLDKYCDVDGYGHIYDNEDDDDDADDDSDDDSDNEDNEDGCSYSEINSICIN